MRELGESLRWADGRSGPAGQVAGEIVIESLERARGEEMEQERGTVFCSESAYWIARSCGTDTYLTPGVRHWANLSWDQYRQWRGRAQKAKKRLFYLFVTGREGPVSLEYWVVPADDIECVFRKKGKAKKGRQLPIHIRCDGREHLLLRDLIVTPYHQEVELGDVNREWLARAQQASRESADVERHAESPMERAAASPASIEAAPAEIRSDTRSFGVPLAQGGHIELRVVGVMSPKDIERLKQWVDVMSDILTGE